MSRDRVQLVRRSLDVVLRRLVATSAVAASAATCGCQWGASGQNAQGVQFFQSGQYQRAAQYFQQAIQQSPTNADGYYNLAAAYHQLGKQNRNAADLDQAELLYNKALDYDPTRRDAYRALAVLLVDKNQPDKAQRLLEGWWNENPSNPAPKVELARLREELGDRNGAKEYLNQALAIDPYDTRALAALGRLQEMEGNAAQALANYQRSLYRDRFQPEVAARVAALRTTIAGGLQPVTPPGDTRTVTSPPSTLR